MRENTFPDGFEWDQEKNEANIKKHQVSFEDAARIFSDELTRHIETNIINGEERDTTLGFMKGNNIILVISTERETHDGEEVIRIISARAAERSEIKNYQEISNGY